MRVYVCVKKQGERERTRGEMYQLAVKDNSREKEKEIFLTAIPV